MHHLPRKSKTLVINDLHIPYVDSKVLRLLYEFLPKVKPDNLIINGDFLDCFALSKFDKAPHSGKSFLEEITAGKTILNDLRHFLPKTKIYYICGNHEFRLKRYLLSQAPELFDLEALSIPYLLDLKKFNVIWVDSDDDSSWQDTYVQVGDIFVGHFNRVSKHSGATAKALVEEKGVSVLQAHVHRTGVYYKTKMNGETLVGIENGCMCDLKPSYMKNPNWQHGLTVITNGLAEPIFIRDYSFAWGGREYKWR